MTEKNDYQLWRVAYTRFSYRHSNTGIKVHEAMYIVAQDRDEAIKKAKRTQELKGSGSELEAEVFSSVLLPILRLPQDRKRFNLEIRLTEKNK